MWKVSKEQLNSKDKNKKNILQAIIGKTQTQ